MAVRENTVSRCRATNSMTKQKNRHSHILFLSECLLYIKLQRLYLPNYRWNSRLSKTWLVRFFYRGSIVIERYWQIILHKYRDKTVQQVHEKYHRHCEPLDKRKFSYKTTNISDDFSFQFDVSIPEQLRISARRYSSAPIDFGVPRRPFNFSLRTKRKTSSQMSRNK